MPVSMPYNVSLDSMLNRMLYQEGAAANTGQRVPVLWESPLSRREGRSLRMVINPRSLRFDQPKRISFRDTIAGKTFYHWTDSRGKNNDILTLTFNGITGNIDPRVLNNASVFPATSSIPDGMDRERSRTAFGNLAKHLAWAKLYQLTADPIVDQFSNRLNLVTCTIQTVLLPFPIQFEGHFPAVMSFTDSADNPFSKDWSLSLVVRTMNPPLSTIVSLLQIAFITGADLSELQQPLTIL